MYLNVVQLAESFGVEESVVEGWVRNEGLPAIEDRKRWLFDRGQVVAWAAERGLVARAGFLASARSLTNPHLGLETLLRTGGIWRDIAAAEVVGLLERVVGLLPGATPQVRKILMQRLHAPGGVTWAPVGSGLALPHLRAHVALGRDAGLLAIFLLREALPLNEPPPDGVPVTRLLFFIAPSPRAHLDLLAQLSTALKCGPLRERLLKAASDTELFDALAAGALKKEGPA